MLSPSRGECTHAERPLEMRISKGFIMRFSRQSRTGRQEPLWVALIAASLLALTLSQATAFAGNVGDTGAGPASPALVPPPSEPSYGEA